MSTNRLGRIACTCHPNYLENVNRRIAVKTNQGKMRPYSKKKNNLKQQGL
jgi:hypothetical protein